MRSTLLLLSFLTTLSLSTSQQAPICEDTISSLPPFNNNAIPCLLGCGYGEPRATGSLLPGSVNTTKIPYCRLDCVRPSGATPAQSSAAPDCNSRCEKINAATPDQLGWCMYWCVEGGEIESLVVSTTCVPSIQYTPIATETTDGLTLTVQGFTMPTQWYNWYQTQTVIPRTGPLVFAPTSTGSVSSFDGGYYDSSGSYHAASVSTPATTTLAGLCGTSEYEVACPSSTTTSPAMTSAPETTSRRHLFSLSFTSTVTGDAQAAPSEGTQSASTTSSGSGLSEMDRRPRWMLQVAIAWVVALV